MLSPVSLSDEKMNFVLSFAKSDSVFLQGALDQIYSFTSQHRKDKDNLLAVSYGNAIKFLTMLYDDSTASLKQNVMTCLRRCWENLASLARFPGVEDYSLEALFSPALSSINHIFFNFIFSPNHKLTPEQRQFIQDWIKLYHRSPAAGKPGKDRYTHFYAWMILLHEKVRKSNTLALPHAQRLMRDKYKVIRAMISLRFGFLSGYNDDYKSLRDVGEVIIKEFPEYAALCCTYIPESRHATEPYFELFQAAGKTTQQRDLDELMRIFFTKSGG